MTRLVLLLVVFAAGFAGVTASAQADREFSLRYSANETGSIVGIANTNMTCSTASGATGSSTCSDARSAGITDSVNNANDMRNNNAHTSAYIDVDSDGSTFNSSTANQSLPAGSTILFAGLYWGGHYSGASSPANANLRDQVKFKVPGASSYTTVSASTLDDGVGSNAGRYQAFADVTNLVKTLPNAGNGTYAVADIQAAIGSDRYAGWSLIVAYKNPNESMKNMTIFDGLVSISGTTTRDINISGFLTPPSGPVNSEVGFVTWEGDLGLNGDRAQINGQYLSDAQHPSNNFFDSRISRNGSLFTDRNPAYPNSLGMDAAWTTAPAGAIGNNATSAKITVRSTGDQYLPGVITHQVEIFSPKVEQTKTATDVNGGNLEQGDVITYKIAGKNTGDDGTANFVLRDPIPGNTTYVPGSIKINKSGGAPTGNQTDASGDDRAEFDSANNRIIARLGTGSNASVGGNIGPGQEYEVTFQVRVNGPINDPVPNLTVLHNEATATLNSQTAGITITSDADVDVTVKAPDLRIKKTRTGADFVAGGTSQYTLAVDNHGAANTQGQVTVSDPLPAGLTATAVNAPGWTCNALPADHLSCTRSDALAPGASYPNIVVTVAIGDDVDDELENISTVSGGGDANLGDNSSSSTNPVSHKADLAIVKTASQSHVKIGDTFSYALKVTNNGPSKATSVAITDDIPAGLSFVSADPGCTYQPVNGTVVCAVGTLTNGATTTINVTVKVDGDAAGQIQNTASVSAQQEDPNPGNNTDTETVDASGADLQVTKTLKSPTDPVKTGDTVVYDIVVKNNGPSDATGVVLYDALPSGLANVTTDNGSCVVAAGAINCALGDIDNGDSVTVEVTGVVKPGQDELVNTASATGNEDDPVPSNNTDDVTTPVTPQADLAIQKLASVSEITPGVEFTYTFKVTNNGPDNVTGITVTDTLPAGVTYVDGAPGCNAVGQAVTCTINFLAAGGSGQTGISVKYTGNGNAVANTAKVGSNVPDPNPGNNTSTIETPVKNPNADVQIVKTVDDPNPEAGDTITYTLTVKNNGPGTAQHVVATDQLPDGVTFLSADSPCVELNGKVTCELGDLASGEEVALKIKVKVNAWTTNTNTGTHGVDVQKVETQIDLNPGETKTIQAVCPSGFFVSDGSVRIDHVDQGTGDWTAPEVLESRAINNSTWQGTVKNTATGRVQAKIFAVCIRETTSPDTTGHSLKVSDPVATTVNLHNGNNEATLSCPAGTTAIQPGFIADEPGLLVYSQPEGNGWKFVYKTDSASSGDHATFSIRCLSKELAVSDGHSHNLSFQRIWTEQTIQPGDVNEVQLICPDGSKGIVGGWDLDDGLVSLGNDPRPVTRAFKVYNPTDHPLKARYSLLCLGDRTGGTIVNGDSNEIINTADVASTNDTDPSNNSSSVTVNATPNTGGDPVDPGHGKTPVNNPIAKTIVGKGVSYSASGVTFTLKCSGACGGTAKLSTLKKVRVKGKKYGKGTVLAKKRYFIGKAGTKKIKLKLTKAGTRVLKSGKVKKASLRIAGGTSKVMRVGRR
ncbi:MAG: hypothetical protein BGO23_08735 [Solirubrobacterales bacterium 67-14]|nr:MAG: hypothetical protein BGO23_08735 [Solirubrobacterales bacterium 67-14]